MLTSASWNVLILSSVLDLPLTYLDLGCRIMSPSPPSPSTRFSSFRAAAPSHREWGCTSTVSTLKTDGRNSQHQRIQGRVPWLIVLLSLGAKNWYLGAMIFLLLNNCFCTIKAKALRKYCIGQLTRYPRNIFQFSSIVPQTDHLRYLAHRKPEKKNEENVIHVQNNETLWIGLVFLQVCVCLYACVRVDLCVCAMLNSRSIWFASTWCCSQT